MTSGPWQLPTDLVGGLSVADKTSDPGSVFEKNLLTAVTREIGVRDGVTQVTEKHLALAAMNHRRLSLQNSDEYDLEERMVTKSGANRPAVCDTGVQCEHDGSIITTSDSDGFAKAMATLKSCFPQVDVENVEDILTGCGGQLEWAVNVLLDSGYDVDWCTTKESIEKEVEAVIESELSDQSLPSETQDALEVWFLGISILKRWYFTFGLSRFKMAKRHPTGVNGRKRIIQLTMRPGHPPLRSQRHPIMTWWTTIASSTPWN